MSDQDMTVLMERLGDEVEMTVARYRAMGRLVEALVHLSARPEHSVSLTVMGLTRERFDMFDSDQEYFEEPHEFWHKRVILQPRLTAGDIEFAPLELQLYTNEPPA
jgi:hypothetical protein